VTTPSQLLADQCRRDGSRPFLTYYDLAAGERVELSMATTANWVAKTANFLTDEYGVDPGDPVTVQLPLHWQTAVVILACWSAGALLSWEGAAVVTFATADVTVDGDAVVLDLTPMGADFSRLVAAQPDDFVPTVASGEDVVRAAADLPAATRVLTVLPYDRPGALSHGLVGPLAAGGSIVLAAHATPGQLAAPAEIERVTHTLGVRISGLPRLDG
jgi:uncharacterized protein (TIGR03089 family)